MNPTSTLTIIVMVGLWAAYLVPTVLRRRQHMFESRADDRFSKDLRIVAVCDRDQVSTSSNENAMSTGALLTPPLGQTERAPSVLAKGVGSVGSNGRPALTTVRLQTLAARQAAARRRGQLALGLALGTLTVAGLALITPLPWLVTMIPAAMLVTVLVLGRRTVLAQEASDRKLVERQRAVQFSARQPSPVEQKLAGRPIPAARPNSTVRVREDLSTSVISATESKFFGTKNATGLPVSRLDGARGPAPKVDTPTAAAPSIAASGGVESVIDAPASVSAHSSVSQQPAVEPTPRYTVRVAAPKWEPPSITTELRKLTAAHMEQITRDADLRDNLAQDPLESHGQSIPDSLGVSLNSILARRRAV